jgi:hypothetical protein
VAICSIVFRAGLEEDIMPVLFLWAVPAVVIVVVSAIS